ncbi:hypothetical protein CBR_g8970 [Chara braunii]|uniref:Uncharacterized protein n=1 Tax=Chara braunii TaxID=69332 RepID=A0A388KNC4_CHABU|nr:hypothetical protein CBR_g8970 [Chara braunii]|eukprot:GBG71552.1 hypothetical protein CBR_g8970 [Chara braunii]
MGKWTQVRREKARNGGNGGKRRETAGNGGKRREFLIVLASVMHEMLFFFFACGGRTWFVGLSRCLGCRIDRESSFSFSSFALAAFDVCGLPCASRETNVVVVWNCHRNMDGWMDG